MFKLAALGHTDDQSDTSTGAFERAGFRVERRGRTTIVERDLPDSVVQTTRELIDRPYRNGNGNGVKADTDLPRNGAVAPEKGGAAGSGA
jgi:hypothetical protein